MTADLMLALAGFAFVMSISPGPGNFLLLASGVNFGFARSIPLVLGISLGFLAMVLMVGLGVGQLLQTYEGIHTTLKVVCAAYVLWLAVKIATSTPGHVSEGENRATPISFVQAALFQLVNPKAWAVALIVTVSYTNQTNYVSSLFALIAVFAVVNLPSISMWAVSGVLLRRIMSNPVHVRAFNVVMALLLAGSMMPILLDFTS